MTRRRPPRDRSPEDGTQEGANSKRRDFRCPKCGSEEVREIVYGLVYERPPFDFEVYHLGGCIMRDKRWHCAKCGHEW